MTMMADPIDRELWQRHLAQLERIQRDPEYRRRLAAEFDARAHQRGERRRFLNAEQIKMFGRRRRPRKR